MSLSGADTSLTKQEQQLQDMPLFKSLGEFFNGICKLYVIKVLSIYYLSFFFKTLHFYIILAAICVSMYACHTVCVERTACEELLLSFHHEGTSDQTQGIRLTAGILPCEPSHQFTIIFLVTMTEYRT